MTFVRHGAKNARNSLSRTIVAASVGVFHFFPPSLVARSERPERMESETRERLEKENARRLGPCREGQCDNTYHALKGTWNMPMLRNAEVRSKNAIGKRKLCGPNLEEEKGKRSRSKEGGPEGNPAKNGLWMKRKWAKVWERNAVLYRVPGREIKASKVECWTVPFQCGTLLNCFWEGCREEEEEKEKKKNCRQFQP